MSPGPTSPAVLVALLDEPRAAGLVLQLTEGTDPSRRGGPGGHRLMPRIASAPWGTCWGQRSYRGLDWFARSFRAASTAVSSMRRRRVSGRLAWTIQARMPRRTPGGKASKFARAPRPGSRVPRRGRPGR